MYSKEKIELMFSVFPPLQKILLAAPDYETARDRFLAKSRRFIEANAEDALRLSGLQVSLRLSCLRAFRQFFTRRSAHLAGFDMVKVLYDMAHKNWQNLPPDLSDAFIEDVYHILSGMAGKAGVYNDERKIRKTGREAGIARSHYLNRLCEKIDAYMNRYSCGLEPAVVEKRNENRRRIMRHFGCSEAEFDDYHWQLRNIIRDSGTLEKLVELTSDEKLAIDRARAGRLPFGITPYYVSLFDFTSDGRSDMPVRAQVIPPMSYVDGILTRRGQPVCDLDFMRESDTSPIDLITRRYPRIVVFKPYNTCSQICVYCQRNWEIDDVYAPGAMASKEKLDAAIDWIAANPAVNEVLVTGGDPLVMTDANIRYVLESLAQIETVWRIRIGSRTPVALPQRITDELADMIASFQQPGRREIVIVTHFEHSLEITPPAMEAIQKFRRRGLYCYNQAVFTIQNCRRYEVNVLRRWLRQIGVEPYYTFNAKGKQETDFYRVPLARLQQEAKEEARLMSGMARTDEPVFNVPGLGKNYLRAEQNHLLLTILPDGRRVYEFHPWEKYISNASSYVYTDLALYDYLKKLEMLGENPEDYKSIYYYF
ncbi:MAG: KamA family radical SAM protein [Candidatus Riflebacteria bacterium HGW-Riflebacteria-2]|nr:MAG: KamA family radical SAM protein [Candidatus Riflebacteria bacterium HGW-Riflebacteria-2]